MKLKVLGSSSKGNCYLLESKNEVLIIEAGVPLKEVLQAIDFRRDKIVACLVTHEHKDHDKYSNEYFKNGISVIRPFNSLFPKKDYLTRTGHMGGFSIKCFENHHNVPCYGFHIEHEELGKLIFATDTGYIEYKFKDINHWLIECNYSKKILDKRVEDGFNPVLADRIVSDHMSLETCKDFFKANTLTKTRNIVLIHLSDGNSNAEQFKREIQQLTNKTTYVADRGLEIDLSQRPF